MNNELYHWKYIKKIPIGSGYRYFYSIDELRAFYGQGKKEVKNVSRSIKKKFSRSNSARSFVKAKSLKPYSSINNSNKVSGIKDWIENKFKKPAPEVEPDYKYIKKISVDGKTRYFYSDEEYQVYLKRKEYYANEPDFMKGFKKSKDPYTAQEDAILVNPKYDPNDINTDYEYNCAECSAIYELRRRGYDVESNGVSGLPNAWAWWKRQIIEPRQTEKYNTEQRYKEFYKNPVVQEVKYTPPDTSDIYSISEIRAIEEKHNYGNAIRREIEKNPPGSRGDIAVHWQMGGGHSMVWEVDKKGKAHIYDTQVSGSGSRIEYDIRTLSQSCLPEVTYRGKSYYTEIVRTDNLELNKGITKICKNSSSKKKGVSNNKLTNKYSKLQETQWTDKELQTQYPVLYQEKRRK